MHCPSFPIFCFTNCFQHSENYEIFYDKKKVAWISGIAATCLALTAWQIIEDNPWAAMAITVGGICLEVALLILYPSSLQTEIILDELEPLEEEEETPVENIQIEKPSIQHNRLLTEKLLVTLNHLEECYPVKAIDPIRIQDQQKGGIMGQACGDAIGLFTEFTTRQEAQEMVNGQPIDLGAEYPPKFKHGYNWDHIKRFTKNGWTDDTDQALSLLRALHKKMKYVDKHPTLTFELLFAVELRKWLKFGLKTEGYFIGREDPYCMGLGALVASVLRQPDFLKHPQKTAEEVWAKDREKPLQNRPAANGAIMRTAPIGFIFYHSLADVVYYTMDACKVTHADPRCAASCVALNLAIALALRGYDSDDLFKAAEEGGLAVLRQELDRAAEKEFLSEKEIDGLEDLYTSTAKDFKEHLDGTWETLDLDEGWDEKGKINKIGYTFKCMGAAFYALRLAGQYQKENKTDIFRTIIEEITAEGGDADTNGAAAGALIGAYLGYEGQFPSNWTDHLADKPVIEQAIKHLEEIAEWHQKTLP